MEASLEFEPEAITDVPCKGLHDWDVRLGLLPGHGDTVVSVLSIAPRLCVGVVVCKNQIEAQHVGCVLI